MSGDIETMWNSIRISSCNDSSTATPLFTRYHCLNETAQWTIYNAGPSQRPFVFGDDGDEKGATMGRFPLGWLANGLHETDRTAEWWNTVRPNAHVRPRTVVWKASS